MNWIKELKEISKINEWLEENYGDRFWIEYNGRLWDEDEDIEMKYDNSYVRIALYDRETSKIRPNYWLFFEPNDFKYRCVKAQIQTRVYRILNKEEEWRIEW